MRKRSFLTALLALALVFVMALGSIPARAAAGSGKADRLRLDRPENESEEKADESPKKGQKETKKEKEKETIWLKKTGEDEETSYTVVRVKLTGKANGKANSLKWKSSNKKIAKVKEDGRYHIRITATKPGKVKITGTDKETKKVVWKKTFYVKKRAESIKVDKSEIHLGVNENENDIRVLLIPEDSTDVIRYISDDKSIVHVNSEGRITAKKVGTTTISVIAKATKGTPDDNKDNLIARITVMVGEKYELKVPQNLKSERYYINDEGAEELDATAIVEDGPCIVFDSKTGERKKSTIREEITYQWVKDYVDIEGATSPKFRPDLTEVGKHIYYCKVSVPDIEINGVYWAKNTVGTNTAKITVISTVEITLDANGGKFTSKSSDHTIELGEGEAIGNLPNDLTRENYNFIGWATTQNATSANVDSSTTFDRDTTIYAVWEKRQPIQPPSGTTKPGSTEPRVYGIDASDNCHDLLGDGSHWWCEDVENFTLTVRYEAPSEKSVIKFKWYKNGSVISDATGASYVFAFDDTIGTDYRVDVINTEPGCSSTVKSATVKVSCISTSRPVVVIYLGDNDNNIVISNPFFTDEIHSNTGFAYTQDSVNIGQFAGYDSIVSDAWDLNPWGGQYFTGDPLWSASPTSMVVPENGTWTDEDIDDDEGLLITPDMIALFADVKTKTQIYNAYNWTDTDHFIDAADDCYLIELYALPSE